MTVTDTVTTAQRAATVAWSRRVRRVGGFIQVGFAAFWLIRGSLNIANPTGAALAIGFTATVAVVVAYGIRVTAGQAPRPTSPEGQRIERAVTIATVIQLAASFAVPAAVIAAGQSDWVLPSIAITIGPLLLWLDHRVGIPRYRPVGWALVIGPVVLAATLSGPSLAAATGIAAGMLLLATAAAGFHDLTDTRLTVAATHRPTVPAGTRHGGLSRPSIAGFATMVIGGTALIVVLIHAVTDSWATSGVVGAIATGLSVTGYAWLGRPATADRGAAGAEVPAP